MTLKNLDKVQLENTIEQMKIGETGFIIPWGLLVDAKTGDAYLEKDLTVDPECHGTVEMQVTRTSTTDYEVDVSCVRQWTFLEDRLKPAQQKDLIKVGNVRSYCTEQQKEALK